MEKVSSYTIEKITNKLLGKRVRFTSDCELFPNFDIKCKVLEMKLESNEIIFTCKLSNGKTIPVGSNMHNLQFEII